MVYIGVYIGVPLKIGRLLHARVHGGVCVGVSALETSLMDANCLAGAYKMHLIKNKSC